MTFRLATHNYQLKTMTSKFWLVAQREYLTRVRKKSFLVLTLLVPLLVAGFGFFIAKIATSDNEGIDVVRVLDASPQHLGDRLKTTSRLAFVPVAGPLETAKKAYRRTDDAGLLYLPPTLTAQQTTGVQLFAKGNVSLRKQSGVEEALNKVLSEEKLRDAGISQEKLKTLRSSVDIASINLDAEGKEKSSNALATSGISYVLALLIYMFIFIYGVQIMRGVGGGEVEPDYGGDALVGEAVSADDGQNHGHRGRGPDAVSALGRALVGRDGHRRLHRAQPGPANQPGRSRRRPHAGQRR